MKTSARSNSRQTYHRGNVREDLIAVGKEILESEDLHALTLRRLTREIGVNPTNFYNHFANMDYLFAAIKVEGFSELLKRSRKATEDQSSKPAALRALFREYIFFAIKNPNLYRLMFDYYLDFDDPDVFDSSDPLGFYKSHPMAVTCWSTMHGLTHILIGRQIKLKTKSRKEVGEFADSIVDVLLDGVLERVRRNTRSRKKAR
jgi:AcrR family transcriptional regulator